MTLVAGLLSQRGGLALCAALGELARPRLTAGHVPVGAGAIVELGGLRGVLDDAATGRVLGAELAAGGGDLGLAGAPPQIGCARGARGGPLAGFDERGEAVTAGAVARSASGPEELNDAALVLGMIGQLLQELGELGAAVAMAGPTGLLAQLAGAVRIGIDAAPGRNHGRQARAALGDAGVAGSLVEGARLQQIDAEALARGVAAGELGAGGQLAHLAGLLEEPDGVSLVTLPSCALRFHLAEQAAALGVARLASAIEGGSRRRSVAIAADAAPSQLAELPAGGGVAGLAGAVQEGARLRRVADHPAARGVESPELAARSGPSLLAGHPVGAGAARGVLVGAPFGEEPIAERGAGLGLASLAGRRAADVVRAALAVTLAASPAEEGGLHHEQDHQTGAPRLSHPLEDSVQAARGPKKSSETGTGTDHVIFISRTAVARPLPRSFMKAPHRTARVRARRAPLAGLALGGVALLLGGASGCNSFTGADDLMAEGAGGDLPFTSGAGNGPTLLPADGVTITRVELYQGLQNTLMKDGETLDPALRLVIGREGLFRIFYDVEPGFEGSALTARLTLGEEIFEVPAIVGSLSNESSMSSTINVEVPGEAMIATTYRVDLLQPREATNGDNTAARHPTDPEATAQVMVRNPGGPLHIRLLPIRYDADGSGRLPDTSEGQVALIRDYFYKMYPVAEVAITVDVPMPWSQPVSPNGAGFGALLDAVTDYRQAASVPAGEYLFGLVRPAETHGDFCGGGCTSGLANLAPEGAASQRAGIGLGFPGDRAAETAIHEVAHIHGRGHAPCGGASSLDPGFPDDEAHAEASIGLWGHDLTDGSLIAPTTKDFMSYCDPSWVSDYTFAGLLERIVIVNGQADVEAAGGAEAQADGDRLQRVSFDPDGTSRWHAPVVQRQPIGGITRRVTVVEGGAERQLNAHFVPYDHLDGGWLLYPSEIAAQEVRLRHRGRTLRLTR